MSEATTAGRAFVARHRSVAQELGDRLAELVDQPELFMAALSDGLAHLSDPAYARLLGVVSPGAATVYAVRGPLVDIVQRPLRRALRESSSATALWLAQRLVAASQRDVRLFALPCLRRSLADDPEQSWQLMRRLAAGAGDWIEVDSLAEPWARGILAEPFRWAELEQLVYSPRLYERRLVAACLAALPHLLPPDRRADLGAGLSQQAFGLIRLLMGDDQAMVQKALAWAIREWSPVDPAGSAQLLRDETAVAVERADGARAWVIRASLPKQPVGLADELRGRLAGIRRRPGAPSASVAASRAVRFAQVWGEDLDTVARQGERYTRSHA